MTNFKTILALTASLFATGCADLDTDGGRDFGLNQDFAYGETGDMGDLDAGDEADAGQTDGDEPKVPNFNPAEELVCGDGVVEGREECDDGELNGLTEGCTPECLFNTCGDGYLLVGIEECDTGALNGVQQDGWTCTESCVLIGVE